MQNKSLHEVARDFFHAPSEAKFNKLANLATPVIKRSAKPIVKNESDALDVVNRVLLKFWDIRDKFEFSDDKPFLGYCMIASVNTAKAMYRKGRRKLPDEPSLVSSTVTYDKDGNVKSSDKTERLVNEGKNRSFYKVENPMYDMGDGDSYEGMLEVLHYKFHSEDEEMEETVDTNTFMHLLQDFMKLPTMDPITRQIIIGFFITKEFTNYTEIKEKFNLGTVGAVKTRVFRFRAKLKKYMVERGFDNIYKSDDIFYAYYTNGQARVRSEMSKIGVDGDLMLNGKWVEYYPSGNVKGEGTRINGELHGECMEFEDTFEPVLKCKGSYTNGFKDGKWFYFEEGVMHTMLDYHMDELGYYEKYDEMGAVIESDLVGQESNPIDIGNAVRTNTESDMAEVPEVVQELVTAEHANNI